jgi:hypothetical protein
MSDERTQDDVAEIIEDLEKRDGVTHNVDDGSWSVRIAPVEHRGQTYDMIKFDRAPCGRDWLETDREKGDVGKGYRLAASLSGVPFAVFLNMTGEDAMTCVAVAGVVGKK